MRSHDDCINLSGPTPAWRGRRFQVRHWWRSSLRRGGDCAIVMVVDDHIPIHQLARRILEPEGYMVVPAADAPAARSALRSTAAHDVLCDVHMPGPTGRWLAKRIRDSYPTTAIVSATADATLQPAHTFRKGMVGYVLER